MAESKGALIAKTVQKHAGRAKEKVFIVLLLYIVNCIVLRCWCIKTYAAWAVKVVCEGSVAPGYSYVGVARRHG